MVRWSYLLPRLTIVLTIVGAFYFGFDRITRFGLVLVGQRLTGARVDVGNFSSKLRSGRVSVNQLAVANPKRPAEDLFRCGDLYLDLNNDALLRRNWVVDNGALHGIELGTLRTDDGSLPTEDQDGSSGSGWADQVSEAGEAWVKQTGKQFSSDITNELQSPALVRELRQRWPGEYELLEQRARRVRDDAKALEEDSKRWKNNPLAAVEQIPQIVTRVDSLRKDAIAIKGQLSQFRTQADQDRKAVLAARQHDQAYLKERLSPEQLKPEQLTKYLVGTEWKPTVDQLLSWIAWGRTQLSNRPRNSALAGRGRDIDFFAAHPRPRWLVKTLDLDGTGQANGQPFSFRGQLTDLTSDPVIVQRPAKLNVELSGAHQAHVEVLVDHTGAEPQETIVINCPRIVRHAAKLGKDDGLALHLAPGEARLGVQLKFVGDQLQGNIAMQQPNVKLTPAVSGDNDIAPLQTALTEAATAVQQLDVNIRLDGHWKKPDWQIDSNLGRDLASGVNRAVRAELTRRGDDLIDRADAEVDEQMAEWLADLEAKQQSILGDLQIGEAQLEWLKEQFKVNLPLSGLSLPNLPIPGLSGQGSTTSATSGPNSPVTGTSAVTEAGKSAVKDALRKVLR